MAVLSIDIETYCDLDLKDVGVYRYVDHHSFEILLFAYAFDNGPVEIVDLASGEQLPDTVLIALQSPNILKTAFNANFERVCLSQYLKRLEEGKMLGDITRRQNEIQSQIGSIRNHRSKDTTKRCKQIDEIYNLEQGFDRIEKDRAKHWGFKSFIPKLVNSEDWECTMVKSGVLGLPMKLDVVGRVLGIDKQKLESGTALINFFSKPCKPTKKNEGRTRNLPHHDPEKWEEFKRYCVQDVEAEREIKQKLSWYTVPEQEKDLYNLDQKINDTGILIDPLMVHNAIDIDTRQKEELMAEAKEITGLDNPNSLAQLKDWLKRETGRVFQKLDKEVVGKLLDEGNLPEQAARILQIRQLAGKTSVKKYDKMEQAICSDGRARGFLQFYGANRTGRWAGRLVQVQNLPQNKIGDLNLARELVLANDYDTFQMVFENPAAILSQLIRTAFIAPKGKTFVVSDFSAIEARVIAWLAGEQWRLDVFNSHGKIYEASAAKMLHKNIDDVTKDERSKGKVAELALGYQGGAGALIQMGALNMGIAEDELPELVNTWRLSNPSITQLWRRVQAAAIGAIKGRGKLTVNRLVTFHRERGYLVITLPSGRQLFYYSAGIGVNRFDSESITYYGMNQTTKKWEKNETYGGKLVENIVQAIARDCLTVVLLRLDAMGYKQVMHVHDEVIVEVSEELAEGEMDMINEEMAEPISWAEGLPLKGDGYITKYYKKD